MFTRDVHTYDGKWQTGILCSSFSAQELLRHDYHYVLFESSVVEKYLVSSSPLEADSHHNVFVVKASENNPMTWCSLVGQLTAMSNFSIMSNFDLDKYAAPYAEDAFPTDKEDDTPVGGDILIHETDLYPAGVIPLHLWWNMDKKRARVILDVAGSQGWTQFLILYEKQFEHQVRALTDLASSSYVKVQVADIARRPELEDTLLQYLETSPDFNAVLVTSMTEAQTVLQLAQSLESRLGKRISVTVLSKWLIFCPEGTFSFDTWMFSSNFNNIALVCDPQQVALDETDQDSEQDVQLVLSTLLYKSKGRELASVGSVHKDWSLTLHQDIFPNVKFGFNGRKFIVSTNMWPPYVYSRVVNGSVEYYGFCMDLAEELSRTMNFTIEWVEPPDGHWGAVDANGSWNGLVGQMQREEIDLIVAPIGVTGAREAVIDFSSSFFYDDTAVILKMPDPNKSKWRTYIDIFRGEVLMCIGAALFIGSIIIFLLTKAELLLYGRQHKVFASSFNGCVMYLYGAMLAQGTFSGNLIAVLTVSKDKAPFDTLRDMASQDEYRFGTLGNSMWTELFRTSPRPEFTAIHLKMQEFYKDDPDIFHNDAGVHLKKVKSGSYAYIADRGLFSFWLATNCDLILLKEKFFPSKYAIGLPNNSVYTKIFSDQVGKIYESGLLQVWVKKWWPKQTFCSGSLVTQARELSLMDVQSGFYVLAIGLGVSGVVLMAETGYAIFRRILSRANWVQRSHGILAKCIRRLLIWVDGAETGTQNRCASDGKEAGHRREENGGSVRRYVDQSSKGWPHAKDETTVTPEPRIWDGDGVTKRAPVGHEHQAQARLDLHYKNTISYRDIFQENNEWLGLENVADRFQSDFTNLSTLNGNSLYKELMYKTKTTDKKRYSVSVNPAQASPNDKKKKGVHFEIEVHND
ncbi:glutamate receptor [Plakobranchus ocellatus]|uniref:Glutamate receptor n=1 Tax=Plakobranchus ocellatus TaxID=259542 RepID=A0AAV3ZRD8_9GAST|nr:glutamate receptor [Plakobranchus ocellatus]